MQLDFFIARRIFYLKGNGFSMQMIRIAIISIVLCISVSLCTIAIIKGFKLAISEKVAAFGSHIVVSKLDDNVSFEQSPINEQSLSYLDSISKIKKIRFYIEKAAIINLNDNMRGVVMKGFENNVGSDFFDVYLQEGVPYFTGDNLISDKIVLSRSISNRMSINVLDTVVMYFVTPGQSFPSARKFVVSGIYKTGLPEFDDKVIFCDINQLRKLNKWNEYQASGCEIFVYDTDDIVAINDLVYSNIGYDLKSETIFMKFPQIFEWLELQNINAAIIIILVLAICTITIVSFLLIIIIEKAPLIGLFKSLGAKNSLLRKIFINYTMMLLGVGLVFGNILSLILIEIQSYFKIIKLPEETYYISAVPVELDFFDFVWINMGIIVISFFALYLPSVFINKISPVKTIKMD